MCQKRLHDTNGNRVSFATKFQIQLAYQSTICASNRGGLRIANFDGNQRGGLTPVTEYQITAMPSLPLRDIDFCQPDSDMS